MELDRFAGPDNDAGFRSTSYDITEYASANTWIRFQSAPTSMNYLDKVQVDNVRVSKVVTPNTHYPALVGADQLHDQGNTGASVTVAVVDTGYWPDKHLDKDLNGQGARAGTIQCHYRRVIAGGCRQRTTTGMVCT